MFPKYSKTNWICFKFKQNQQRSISDCTLVRWPGWTLPQQLMMDVMTMGATLETLEGKSKEIKELTTKQVQENQRSRTKSTNHFKTLNDTNNVFHNTSMFDSTAPKAPKRFFCAGWYSRLLQTLVWQGVPFFALRCCVPLNLAKLLNLVSKWPNMDPEAQHKLNIAGSTRSNRAVFSETNVDNAQHEFHMTRCVLASPLLYTLPHTTTTIHWK